MSQLRVAIAQFNAVLGDIQANISKIQDFVAQAHAQGADLLVTPELALCGYPPEDLLLRPDFYRACDEGLVTLAAHCATQFGGMAILVGHPAMVDGKRFNRASLVQGGKVTATYDKQCLPNAQVFDEERYFEAGTNPCVFDLKGVSCAINICEDVWQTGPVEVAKSAGAELLLVLNASPLHLNKLQERQRVMACHGVESGLAALYVNLVGGQDELVFDGGSFAINPDGQMAMRLPQFEETLACVDYHQGRFSAGEVSPALSEEAETYQALVVGVRDYLGKNGFPGAIIGLSGGIDSALTLCVAVDALGADKVRAVMMPSPYTAQMSLDDSRAMVEALGVRYDEIAIAPAMNVFSDMLAREFAGLPMDTTEENLQARIRGNILMALSNKTGALVLTTGNKSEMAVGYCTLYGDMAGGFAVIKDVYKTLVYRVSRYRNTLGPVIPENIIVRPPSAELRPDQKDQDSLPPYEILDAIVQAYMEEDLSPRQIIARGLPEADVRRVVRLLRIAEYKRRQAPVGIRVTPRGFGKDWRYPITNRYRDEF